MDSKESFERLWRKRYPDISPPNLPCLNVLQNKTINNSQQTRHNNNSELIQDEIQKRQCHISELQYKIEQEEFVVKYLWEILSIGKHDRLKQPQNAGGEYYNLPDDNVCNSISSPSPSLATDSSQKSEEEFKKFSGSEHRGHLNDKSRINSSPSEYERNTVQTELSHSSVNSSVDQNVEDTGVKVNIGSTLLQATKGNSFSGSPKPSVKPRVFNKSASLSEKRGSQKSRPPVPAPRPSTKGPTYKSRVSFAVESPTSPESPHGLTGETVSPSSRESVLEMKQKFEAEIMTKPSIGNALTGCLSSNQESTQTIGKLPEAVTANLPLLTQATQRAESPKQTDIDSKHERSSTHIFLDGISGSRESSTDMEMEPDELMSTPVRPPRRVSELSQIQQMNSPPRRVSELSQVQQLNTSADRLSTSTTEDVPESDDAENTSDEEAQEPIYFNMQELIQRSLTMDNSALYKTMKTSAQKEKQALERAARRLTQRITMQELGHVYKVKESEDDTSSVDDNLDDEPGESECSLSSNTHMYIVCMSMFKIRCNPII